MISLRDSIDIRTTPGEVFAWLEQMPRHYTLWHPAHVSCRVLHGSLLAVGSEIECEEFLHGKSHKLRFRITNVVPDQRVEFAIAGMGRGAFEARGNGYDVRFTAELEIGSRVKFIDRLLDFVFLLLFRNRIAAMRQHMLEEGRNLKAILETGTI
ncbi:MAG: SRPBCC family protein [Candidatus Neomarinimicrobiota bacterium]